MRIRLSVKQNKPDQLIPINYQFLLSSFIYKTIENSDGNYSRWLHDSGFMSGNKKFKMFTFSKLNIPKSSFVSLYGKSFLKIECSRFEFDISMMSNKTVEKFIIGMFMDQKMNIYEKNVESEFSVNTVEMVPEPEIKEEMIFRTISPMVLSRSIIHNGKQSQEYLSPEDPEYFNYLKKNLLEKQTTLLMSKNGSAPDDKDSNVLKLGTVDSFELKGNCKSKLITIKEGTAEETKIKGYYMTFKIKADPEIIRTSYEAGFGKHCSLGFGCVQEVR
ncbi:MAG: CRISPR-associated endoribonuclease Cas6 [Bacteroidetes bacterium]|nr:CRISPR-associated endoribonuclease Cas6 [Bacteroidota bacterium]